MAYGFYFDGAEVPITPGSVKFNYEGNNKSYTLIDEGEINVLKLPGLQEITFEILLPTQEYPFANNSETSPSTWLDMFESWQTNKTPFQFVITRTTDAGESYHGTSIRCAIETWNTEENAESYGTDVNVSMTLKQYKEYGTKTVTVPKSREQDNAPTTPASVDADKADNPVAMSKVMTNSSGNAEQIADDNGYGYTDEDGSYKKEYRDYGAGTKAGSDNAAYVQGDKDSAASASAQARKDAKVLISGGSVSGPKNTTTTRSSKFTVTGPTTTTTGKTAADLLATAIANRDTSKRVSSQAMTFEKIK